MAILLDAFQALLNAICGPLAAKDNERPPLVQQPISSGQGQQHHQQQHETPQGGHSPHKPQNLHPHQNNQPHHPSAPPSHPNDVSTPSHQRPHHYQDDNQVNQHNEHYMSLRARAHEEGEHMAKCFEQSHQASARHDEAQAKVLSNQGHEHQRKMDDLNKEASDWIFIENNKDSKPGEIDLHGLFVKEAIVHTELAIQEAKTRGDSNIHIIVGKGLHSPGGVAKLKPAIEELIHNHQLVTELDPHNAGVLIVHLDGGDRSREGVLDADAITRRLEPNDEHCVVM